MYRKERIDHSILFFAGKHYSKTHQYLSQTFLSKYLAFFEFRYLKTHGDMPLELTYKAMRHGPVPVEIYDNRNNPAYFSLVTFESYTTAKGGGGYLVKPKGRFEADYFAEDELAEMNSLIEMFAQQWVNASIVSEASHQAIKAWRKTYNKTPNGYIDPIEEFDRNISAIPEDELSSQEERYLIHRKIAELTTC
jgi:hypothetical protein